MSLVLTTPALDATVSSTGDKIIFHDYKGYESDWRKHHTSAVTRDIWVYDTGRRSTRSSPRSTARIAIPSSMRTTPTSITCRRRAARSTSTRAVCATRKQSVAVTRFAKHPVRFLTRAKTARWRSRYDGELYTMAPGGQPKKVAVRIGADGRNAIEKILPINGGMTEAKLSPNGKEFAFVFRGEIFVSSIDGKFVKRITNTPWQERTVELQPRRPGAGLRRRKGQQLERLYEVAHPCERAVFLRVDGAEGRSGRRDAAEEFQPAFSPDGKEIAYLENRQTLKVYNIASKQSRTVLPGDLNYSYSDGDQYYSWSPDSQWLLVQFAPGERMFAPEVGIVAADGESEVRNLTRERLRRCARRNGPWTAR